MGYDYLSARAAYSKAKDALTRALDGIKCEGKECVFGKYTHEQNERALEEIFSLYFVTLEATCSAREVRNKIAELVRRMTTLGSFVADAGDAKTNSQSTDQESV